ncbi:MAG: tRNA (guanosine(46)-N7)-methyltransferase TrmB [Bacilli bacterium]
MRTKFKKWAVDYLVESTKNEFFVNDNEKSKIDEFINAKDTYLEIGPGKGQFILSIASKYPHYNFIVIEINKTIAGICLKKIDDSGLNNVRLIADDFYNFSKLIKPDSIKGIFLNFSDPWPKKRWIKFRLTSDKFLIEYSKILVDKGIIYQKTDNEGFFNYSYTNLIKYKWSLNNINLEYNDLVDFDASTEFETRYKNMGKKIYRLEAINTKDTIKELIKESE